MKNKKSEMENEELKQKMKIRLETQWKLKEWKIGLIKKKYWGIYK